MANRNKYTVISNGDLPGEDEIITGYQGAITEAERRRGSIMSDKYYEAAYQKKKRLEQQLMRDYDLRNKQINIAIRIPGMGYPQLESVLLKSSINSTTAIVITKTHVVIPRVSLTPEYLNEFFHLVWAARKIFESNVLTDFEKDKPS